MPYAMAEGSYVVEVLEGSCIIYEYPRSIKAKPGEESSVKVVVGAFPANVPVEAVVTLRFEKADGKVLDHVKLGTITGKREVTLKFTAPEEEGTYKLYIQAGHVEKGAIYYDQQAITYLIVKLPPPEIKFPWELLLFILLVATGLGTVVYSHLKK